MSKRNFSVIGLPESGKTTFLAALWSYILSEDESCKLVLDGYTKIYAHLNEIQKSWERAETVSRTVLQSNNEAVLNLRNKDTGESFEIILPDISGEEFEIQISERKVSPYFLDICKGATGFLVFMTADKNDSDMTHHDLKTNIQVDENNQEEWDHSKIPDQVKLIELLQFILMPPFEKRMVRIALIISAWDVVIDRKITPQVWIEKEYPMLSQFIATNKKSINVNFYGVSAQGGDISDKKTKSRLLELIDSSSRIICQENEIVNNDITSPLLWIMSSNGYDK